MAVAFDAVSAGAGGTGNFNWTHTPVGTPKGAWVFVLQDTGQTDEVTDVTYGGVAMTRVTTGSPTNPVFRDGTGADDGGCYTYFLGASIPTGAQTVAVTVNGTGSLKRGRAGTVTAAADTEVVDCNSGTGVNANPSLGTLSLAGRSCFAVLGFWSAEGAVGNITPIAGWTSQNEQTLGNGTVGHYTYDTVGTTDVVCGWTHSVSEDFAGHALAIAEAAGGSVTMGDLPVITIGLAVGDAIEVVSEFAAPDTPTCTVVGNSHDTVDLTGSAFADDDGDLHAASQWQVDINAGDFGTPVRDSGTDTVNKTSIQLNALTPETAYKARVRYKDDSGDSGTEWSAWSTAATFTTDAAPAVDASTPGAGYHMNRRLRRWKAYKPRGGGRA
jgi:hypothetical protein